MNTKLSIIVPVYNVESYIDKCLETLVKQTIKDYEIIIIVDGSTDKSIDIIKKYKNQYPDIIRFYETENRGLSAARNYGLEKAKGKYVGFIDSDDYTSIEMFQKMYECAKEKDYDIVVCDYYRITEEKAKEIILDIKDNDTKENIVLKSKPYAWNKIYKRNMFQKYNLKFPEGYIFEDICTIYPMLLEANTIGYVNEKLYFYRYNRTDSIMKNKTRDDIKMVKVLNKLNKYCKKNNLFNKYNDLLCELNVRHIYYRIKEMKMYNNTKLYNIKFIFESFKLLKMTFPRWKTQSKYAQKIRKKKKLMLYWQYKILLKR